MLSQISCLPVGLREEEIERDEMGEEGSQRGRERHVAAMCWHHTVRIVTPCGTKGSREV